MKNKPFLKYLKSIGACEEAQEWVASNPDKDTAQLWSECERGDWMAWFIVEAQYKLGIAPQQITLALCGCAMLSLKYFESEYPNDKRPRGGFSIS